MKKENLFTKRMRKETSKIHTLSDALINAKLGFGKTYLVLSKFIFVMS